MRYSYLVSLRAEGWQVLDMESLPCAVASWCGGYRISTGTPKLWGLYFSMYILGNMIQACMTQKSYQKNQFFFTPDSSQFKKQSKTKSQSGANVLLIPLLIKNSLYNKERGNQECQSLLQTNSIRLQFNNINLFPVLMVTFYLWQVIQYSKGIFET